MKKKIFALILAGFMILGVLPPALAVPVLVNGAVAVDAGQDIVDSGKCGDTMTWKIDGDGVVYISGAGDMWNYPVRWKARHIGISFVNSAWGPEIYFAETKHQYEEMQIGDDENAKWELVDVNRPYEILKIGSDSNATWAVAYTDRPYEIVELGAGYADSKWSIVYTDRPYQICHIGIFDNTTWTTIEPDYYAYAELLIGNQGNNECWVMIPHVPWFAYEVEKIVLSGNVTDISVGALAGYYYEVDDQNETFFADEDGVLYSYDRKTLISYPSSRENDSYTVPDGVVTIDERAFGNNQNLESIAIPESVKTIERYAFLDCLNLANIYYNGTETEWNNIMKVEDWDFNAGSETPDATYTVHYNNPGHMGDDYSAPVLSDKLSMRVSAPYGMRLRASVTPEQRGYAEEYGCLVACSTDVGEEGLTFDTERFVYGAAFCKADGTDIQYAVSADGTVDFTAVLIGIPFIERKTELTVRTYIKISVGENLLTFYGNSKTLSLYDAALAFKNSDAYETAAPEQKELVDALCAD